MVAFLLTLLLLLGSTDASAEGTVYGRFLGCGYISCSYEPVANATCDQYGHICTCNEGFSPNETSDQCLENAQPVAPFGSMVLNDSSTKFTWGNGNFGCLNGTLVYPSVSYGSEYATGPFFSAGVSCSAGDGSFQSQPVAQNDPPSACLLGQCPGTVNGTSVCVACSSVTSNQFAGTYSPDGSFTGGSLTTSTATPAGQLTTVSTPVNTTGGGQGDFYTVPSFGQSVTTSSTSAQSTPFCAENPGSPLCQAQKSLCQESPNIPACKWSTVSEGCGSFACDGDPAACAAARAAHNQRCQLVEGTGLDGAAKALFDQAKDRPDGPPVDENPTSLQFSNVISQTDLLGGGCPTDASFSVAGNSVSIPFSQLCGPLQMLGSLLVGLSMFAAAFIVFRS